MDAAGYAGKNAHDLGIEFPRIRLAGCRKNAGKSESFGYQTVKRFDFGMVSIEQSQERGLRSGSALDAAELEGGDAMLQFGKIHDELLCPKDGALADGGELGGLEMGIAEGW